MKTIFCQSTPKGIITTPPSKSLSHRLLICASLANGISRINNISLCDDVLATISCLRALGAKIEINNSEAIVKGIDSFDCSTETLLYCNESGSTLRFLLPLCMLYKPQITISGKNSLLSRPLNVYEKLGFIIERNTNFIRVNQGLKSGKYVIDGNISSQFISGLCFVLPLISGNSSIVLKNAESLPYVYISLYVLSKFGIKTTMIGNTIIIDGNQSYKPFNTTVEGDFSSASYLQLLSEDIILHGLNENSLQPDAVYSNYFNSLSKGFSKLDISQCPDLGPALFIYAAMHEGGIFTGTHRLKYKESDRCRAMKEELDAFNIHLTIEENQVIVPNCVVCPSNREVYSHNDHRIAMALSPLLSRYGGVLNGSECVNKSYPDYFKDIRKTGVVFTCTND